VRNPARAPGFEAWPLDLHDLDSVRAFAARAHAEGRTIDLLVNNAGIGNHPDAFATNFLGHFALTGLLLDLMRTDGRARIVHVGSSLYRHMKRLDLDDLVAGRESSNGRIYVGSKLATLVFGLELDRRLERAGRPIRSLVAHPGLANTPMNAHLPSRAGRAFMALAQAAIGRPAERAAIPLLYAATDPAARPGVFLGPHLRKSDDTVYADPILAPATDPALAGRVWRVAEAATGVDIPLS